MAGNDVFLWNTATQSGNDVWLRNPDVGDGAAPQLGDDCCGWFGSHLATIGGIVAGAALALATTGGIARTLNANEDFVAPAAAAVTADHVGASLQRAVQATSMLRWHQPDERPTPVASLIDDVLSWSPSWQVAKFITPQTWRDDEYDPPAAALEVEPWTAPRSYAVAPIVTVFGGSDELGIAPTPAASDTAGNYGSRAAQTTTFNRWYQPDERPTPSAAVQLDDYYPWVGYSITPAPLFGVFDDGHVEPPPVLEDVQGWVPSWPQVKPFLALFEAQDDPPGIAPTPAASDIAGSYGSRAAQTTTFSRWYQPDERPTPSAGVQLDDYYPWVGPSWPQAKPFLALFEAQDERTTPAAGTLAIGEDAPLELLRSKDSATFVVWAENEDVLPQPTALPTDEDPWIRHSPVLVPARATVFQETSTEAILSAPIAQPGDTDGASLGRLRHATTFMRWAAQDEIGIPPTPLPIEENDGPPLLRSQDRTTFVVWAENEEIVPQPPALPSDEDPWIRHRPVLVPALATLFFDTSTEAILSAPVPLPVEDDYWLRFPVQPGALVTNIRQYMPVEEEFPELATPVTPPSVVSGSRYKYPTIKKKAAAGRRPEDLWARPDPFRPPTPKKATVITVPKAPKPLAARPEPTVKTITVLRPAKPVAALLAPPKAVPRPFGLIRSTEAPAPVKKASLIRTADLQAVQLRDLLSGLAALVASEQGTPPSKAAYLELMAELRRLLKHATK